jgi:NUMOD3 motif
MSKQELDEKEKLWIEMLHSRTPNGYNIKEGGSGGGRPTEEMKLRMSLKKKGAIPWNKGKSTSEKSKEKISKARKGQPSSRKGAILSEETRKKISKSRKELFEKKHNFQVGA